MRRLILKYLFLGFVAEDPKLAVAFVKEHLTGEKAAPAKTDVSVAPLVVVLVTDSGDVVGLDTGTEDKKEAVKVDRKKIIFI